MFSVDQFAVLIDRLFQARMYLNNGISTEPVMYMFVICFYLFGRVHCTVG